MILIADSGSTKSDWRMINSLGDNLKDFSTMGFNPYFHSSDLVEAKLKQSTEAMEIALSIEHVFFYGAGCSSANLNTIIKEGLQRIFKNANVLVGHDLHACAFATYYGEPEISCILGTGSNSCYFDGEKMHMQVPSLGYVLMDEASGNYFGKRLIRDYYYGMMPKYMVKKFEKDYVLDPDTIKSNIYREPNPNMYLASFAKFMFDFKDEKYVRKLMKKGFEKFFKFRILPYQLSTETPIYFIGSIAHYFREILDDVADKMDLKLQVLFKDLSIIY